MLFQVLMVLHLTTNKSKIFYYLVNNLRINTHYFTKYLLLTKNISIML
jgi:hypothetical protein